jgi:hypothetical protein
MSYSLRFKLLVTWQQVIQKGGSSFYTHILVENSNQSYIMKILSLS